MFKSEWRGLRRWCLVFRAKCSLENQVARTYLRRSDFDQWGLSEGCPGCRYVRAGQGRQQAHSEACRRRTEALLRGDSSESTRLAAADERISRALADAVERHATKDPRMRGMLKRASVVCHPESELEKKIALDTAQESTPHPQSRTEDHQHQVHNPASPHKH